jgi:hypothetical protein
MRGWPRTSSIAANAHVYLLALHLDRSRLEPQLASRLSRRIALLVRNPVESNPHDCGARKHFASELDALCGELKLPYKNAGNIASGTR